MRLFLVTGGFVVIAWVAVAQERIALSTPETKPANTAYRIAELVLDAENARIVIFLRGENDERVTCSYDRTTTPSGQTLLTALNKANLSTAYVGNGSTGSLVQRVFHRLVVLKESATVCSKALVGTVAGAVP